MYLFQLPTKAWPNKAFTKLVKKKKKLQSKVDFMRINCLLTLSIIYGEAGDDEEQNQFHPLT